MSYQIVHNSVTITNSEGQVVYCTEEQWTAAMTLVRCASRTDWNKVACIKAYRHFVPEITLLRDAKMIVEAAHYRTFTINDY